MRQDVGWAGLGWAERCIYGDQMERECCCSNLGVR